MLPFSMKWENCANTIGTIIAPDADRLAPLKLESLCPECVEKIAISEAVTLDSETSWGKVIARIKGRRQFS